MKKKFLFAFLTFLCVTLGYSQTPTPLTSANFPKPGDSSDVRTYVIPSTESFTDTIKADDSITIDRTLEKSLIAINDNFMKDINIGGNKNVTIPIIIYAQIPGVKSYHRVYSAPNAFTPGVANFPDANLYILSATEKGDPIYTYLKKDNSGFYEVGAYYMGSGGAPKIIKMNPYRPTALFPMDYNTPNNVSPMIIKSELGDAKTTTHYKAIVDAYGNMDVTSGTPASPITKTYNNYLRSVQTNIDTMDITNGMFIFMESKIYSYYVPGYFDPVIVYSVRKKRSNIANTFWNVGNGEAKWENGIEVQWNKEFTATNIPNNSNGEWNMNLFPNPSTGLFKLDMPLFDGKDIVVSVYDINGKKVSESTHNNGIIQIDISDQPVGSYSVRVVTNGFVMNSKLIISR